MYRLAEVEETSRVQRLQHRSRGFVVLLPVATLRPVLPDRVERRGEVAGGRGRAGIEAG